MSVTKRPDWGKFGTWIFEYSNDPLAVRDIVRHRYLSVDNAYIPPMMHDRWRQFEAQDALELAKRRAARAKIDGFFRRPSSVVASQSHSFSSFDIAMAEGSALPVPGGGGGDAMQVDKQPAQPATPVAPAAAAPPQSGRPLKEMVAEWATSYDQARQQKNTLLKYQRAVELKEAMEKFMDENRVKPSELLGSKCVRILMFCPFLKRQ